MIHPDYLDVFEKKLSLDSIRKSVADNTDRHSVIYKRRGPVEGEYKWAQTEWIPCEGGEEVILYVKDITDERIKITDASWSVPVRRLSGQTV